MTNSPLTSGIIPIFNGERYLQEAMESIFNETCCLLDLIVADDGSTDGAATVAARYGEQLRYVQQANGGPAATRNHGLSLAQGEFAAFQDADDVWYTDRTFGFPNLKKRLSGFEIIPACSHCPVTPHRLYWSDANSLRP